MTGIIVHLRSDRGYGFIRSNDDGRDYYTHASHFIDADFDSLSVGQRVSFNPMPAIDQYGPKPRALDVVLMS